MEIVSPGFVDWMVLKHRASLFAIECRKRLADPATDPRIVEDDINWKVAVNDAKYDLTYEQREELLRFVMDESGMTALKKRLLARKTG